jgi:hypothetical protein
LNAVRYVGIGFGIVAIIGFAVALLVYSKKGKKTWESLHRRRGGLQYTYKPPTPKPASSDVGGINPHTPPASPQVPASALAPRSDHVGIDVDGAFSKPSLSPLVRSRPASPQVVAMIPQRALTIHAYEDRALHVDGVRDVEASTPSRPPRPTADMLRSMPALNASEAILVGNQFRTALRVSALNTTNAGDEIRYPSPMLGLLSAVDDSSDCIQPNSTRVDSKMSV